MMRVISPAASPAASGKFASPRSPSTPIFQVLCVQWRIKADDAESSSGGEGGIRTPDTVTRMPHFECGAFNHSATSPWPQRRKRLCAGYVSNAGALNKGSRGRREAGFEPGSQLRAVEIATDQHELVSCLALASILIQGKSLGHEMENVALVAFGAPKETLASVHVFRKSLEEVLKSLHGEGPLALERKRLETVRAQVAVAGTVSAGSNLVAAVT
jgi:hypothetical protein